MVCEWCADGGLAVVEQPPSPTPGPTRPPPGARLVQFPEGALSGQTKAQIKDRARVDWDALREELEKTAACAAELRIWTVLGSEITNWNSPGFRPVVFEVDGYTFGTALCIEVKFPDLFAEYEHLGVDCVLLSSYSEDLMFGTLAQAQAATNCPT